MSSSQSCLIGSTITVNTDKSGIINTTEQATNTTPDIKVTLESQKEMYIRTFGKQDLGIIKYQKPYTKPKLDISTV